MKMNLQITESVVLYLKPNNVPRLERLIVHKLLPNPEDKLLQNNDEMRRTVNATLFSFRCCLTAACLPCVFVQQQH